MRQYLFWAVLATAAIPVCGQKTARFDFSASEARVLDVEPQTIIRPLVAEVVVDEIKGRIRDTWTLTPEEYNSRTISGNDGATLRNLQAYGVFKSAEKHNCDVIVAATFDIHVNDRGATINVVGFPASFSHWATATKADIEWLNMLPTNVSVTKEDAPGIKIKKD